MAYIVKTNGSTKLSPKTLNIDGSEDPFYRYKMRQLYIQVVGKGKMIKTVLLNVVDVAKDLKVNPGYLTAYIGYEIGAPTKFDPKKPEREKASVSGDLDVETLTTILRRFITDIVMCPKCNLPETYMKVEKSGDISFVCRGCGEVSTSNPMKPKFKQFIINQTASEKTSEKQAAPKKDSAGKGKAGKTKNAAGKNGDDAPRRERRKKGDSDGDDDNEDWSVDVSEEAARARRAELLPTKLKGLALADAAKEDVVESFAKWVKEAKRTESEVVDELLKLQKAHQFDNATRVRLFCQACFQPGVAPSASKLKEPLSKLVTDAQSQRSLLDCLELLLTEGILDKALLVLKSFYDEELVEEDAFLRWYADQPSVEGAADVRKKVEPFMTWLREAEEESSDEE